MDLDTLARRVDKLEKLMSHVLVELGGLREQAHGLQDGGVHDPLHGLSREHREAILQPAPAGGFKVDLPDGEPEQQRNPEDDPAKQKGDGAEQPDPLLKDSTAAPKPGHAGSEPEQSTEPPPQG